MVSRKRSTTSDISMYPDLKELNVSLNEDEISTGNTEDSLLSSRTSTESLNSKNRNVTQCHSQQKGKCAQNSCLIIGIIFIAWGILMLCYKPFDMFMDERIKMTPGLPPYEWWLDPPDEVLLKVYLFNVTNAEQFLDGTDSKLRMEEVGPIIYREKLIHTNPTFNENGTFTYTAQRTPIYLPEMNTIDLNLTLVVPNLGVLMIPSYLHDSSFFTKIGVNLMMRTLKSHPFLNTTIYNYMWNLTDPILDYAQTLAPNLVPTKNLGILKKVYLDFKDNVTVYVGSKFGHKKFFLIDKYAGTENLPFGDVCRDKVTGSSEGISYPQFLTKNDTVRYWRKTLCKVASLNYSNDERMYGVDAFKFTLLSSTFDRTTPSEEDCYKGVPRLPNGTSDAAPCNFNMPLAVSFPHFLHGDDVVKNYVDGMKPDEEKHGSYVIIEPNTGIPLHGIARSQCNLVMNNMDGFNEKIKRFSHISIPLAWLEYNQVGIPWYIQWLIYFVVVLVPSLQYVCVSCLFIMGVCLLVGYYRIRNRSQSHLARNKTLAFEKEVFLKH